MQSGSSLACAPPAERCSRSPFQRKQPRWPSAGFLRGRGPGLRQRSVAHQQRHLRVAHLECQFLHPQPCVERDQDCPYPRGRMDQLDHLGCVPREHRHAVALPHPAGHERSGDTVHPPVEFGIGVFALLIHQRHRPRHHRRTVREPVEHGLAHAAASSHGPTAYRSIASWSNCTPRPGPSGNVIPPRRTSGIPCPSRSATSPAVANPHAGRGVPARAARCIARAVPGARSNVVVTIVGSRASRARADHRQALAES